ncbi:DUF4286 family protein [Fluviispira sanaruensis]|uniref:DUF4286 family protein n=1 Tax=Fluviispira sanaruensis TaxID=2493639 RepID=A0A4P2VUX1_FLUSA|nr:DUF4286 family protein [Fluviispira sanaruensis]BBH52682.1 hypothetical protein JCM31447_11230 [Fluviispira sanaruensis]
MIIYEVTYILKDLEFEKRFSDFMIDIHLNNLYQTGCFLSIAFAKTQATGAYKATFYLKDKKMMDMYINKYSVNLRKGLIEKFPKAGIEFLRVFSYCLYFKSEQFTQSRKT